MPIDREALSKAKHNLFYIENVESEIFRVMEVDKFFDLLETGNLSLTAPKLWDDPYENFLKYSYGISARKNVRTSYEYYSQLIFGQCWTLNQETDQIWRVYSPNRDRVKIRTTIKKLHNSVKNIQDELFISYLGGVKYLSESEVKKRIVETIKKSEILYDLAFYPDKLIREHYLIKRDTFQYENEIRLMVKLPTPPENYRNAIYQDPSNLDICNLTLNDPIDLIDEVVFDPRMSESIVEAYTFFLRNSLGFLKPVYKSNLYRKPEIKVKIRSDADSKEGG